MSSQLRGLVLASLPYLQKEVIGYEVKPFHLEWIRFQIARRKSLILAPRTHGKSKALTICYAIWRLLRNPNIRILILANTATKATAFLSEIKQHLEGNQKLISLFGNFVGKRWTDSEITIAQRTAIHTEGTITASGVFGSIVSKHFDIVIADDLLDFENTRTQTQREKYHDWFYMVLTPTLLRGGKIHIIGTRYHHMDHYGYLIDHEYKDNWMRSKAIEEVDGEEQALWEEMYPLEHLREIRRDSGTIIFNAQHQNDIEAMKGKIFKADHFKEYERYGDLISYGKHTVKISELKVYVGADLAISLDIKKDPDYFSLTVVGEDKFKNIFVLDDEIHDRLSFFEQVKAIEDIDKKWKPILIALESNQYQAALGQYFQKFNRLPTKNVITVKDKTTRAIKLAAYFENSKIYMKRDQQKLKEQLLLFPDVNHDDRFDSLEIAVSIAGKIQTKVHNV